MNDTRHFKSMFQWAAAWNIIASLVVLLCSLLYPPALRVFVYDIPQHWFFLHVMLVLIAVFGLGYYIVSLDLTANHGIVTIGVIAKTLFFILACISYFRHEMKYSILIIGMVDAVFAYFFLDFMRRRKPFGTKEA